MPDAATDGNGKKAFGGIAAIVIIAGFVLSLNNHQASKTEAMAQSLTNSIATLRQLNDQRFDLIASQLSHAHDHERSDAHPVAAERLKAAWAAIVEIRRLMHEDDVSELSDAGSIERIREKLLEVETQFRHLDRLIQLLWEMVYGKPLPNPPEK